MLKLYIFNLVCFLSFTLMLTSPSFATTDSKKASLLQDKTSLLDSSDPDTDDIYPFLGFLVDSLQQTGQKINTPLNLVTTQQCQYDIQTNEKFNSAFVQDNYDLASHSCVIPEKTIYKIDRISIRSCQWIDQTQLDESENESLYPQSKNNTQKLPSQMTKSLIQASTQWKKEFILENFHVTFSSNSTLICTAQVALFNQQKMTLSGPCAMAYTQAPDKKVNINSKPATQSLMLFASLQTETKEKITTDSSNSLVSIQVSVPVPTQISKYLQYMLSDKAMVHCRQLSQK